VIDIFAQRIEHWDDEDEAGTAEGAVLAEAEDGDLLPLIDDLDGEEEVDADGCASNQRKRGMGELGDGESAEQEDEEDGERDLVELAELSEHGHGLLLLFRGAVIAGCGWRRRVKVDGEPAAGRRR